MRCSAYARPAGCGANAGHAEMNRSAADGEVAHRFQFLRSGGHGGLDGGYLATNQPCSFASLSRSTRLAWISSSRGICAGSTRSSGHLTQASLNLMILDSWSRPARPLPSARVARNLANVLES